MRWQAEVVDSTYHTERMSGSGGQPQLVQAHPTPGAPLSAQGGRGQRVGRGCSGPSPLMSLNNGVLFPAAAQLPHRRPHLQIPSFPSSFPRLSPYSQPQSFPGFALQIPYSST